MSFTNPWYKRAGAVLFNNEVVLEEGSILYCKLPSIFGNVEHSGIYVGENKVIEYNRDEEVVCISLEEFLGGTSSIRLGLYIYAACDNQGNILHDKKIADNARKWLGYKSTYNVLFNNCHMFTSSCMTGLRDNPDTFFWFLEHSIKDYFKVDKLKWLVANENPDLSRAYKSKYSNVYSYNEGITKYDLDYIPKTPVKNSHSLVSDELLGACFFTTETELYIKYTGHAIMGAWHSYKDTILIDLNKRLKYDCLSVLPYKKKDGRFCSPRISKNQEYIVKLTFSSVNPEAEFMLMDEGSAIYSSFKFKHMNQ